MSLRRNSTSDPVRIAQMLTGTRAFREVILAGPDTSFKWHCHDYPCDLARWNHHPEFELHLIRNASGRFVIGDYVGDFFPGHLCLVGPSLPHHWISSVRRGEKLIARDVVLQFDGQALARALHFLPEAASLERLFALAAQGIEFLGESREQAAAEMLAMGESAGIERLSRFFRLFSILAQARRNEVHLLASPMFKPCSDPAAAPLIDKALDYILAHQNDQIRMEQAAHLVGMSVSAFSRFFKKASGRGFAETVRTMRIVHSCRLLRETEKPIAEICFVSGYDNLSNFNRRFRDETGMTPSAYRAKYNFEENQIRAC